jgi:hypothetical protein
MGRNTKDIYSNSNTHINVFRNTNGCFYKRSRAVQLSFINWALSGYHTLFSSEEKGPKKVHHEREIEIESK